MTTAPTPSELLPCPFCGAGNTEIRENGKVWSGMGYTRPTSTSVFHHCTPTAGQPSRAIERVGRDRASAIAAWNQRTELEARKPLSGLDAMRMGMEVARECRGHATGTTNWATAMTRAYERRLCGITGGSS